jgi:hypothetical protein
MTRWKIYATVLIVLALVGISTIALGLTQDSCVPGPGCEPTGAHAKHTSTCSVCHKSAGRLAFDPTGPAYPASGLIPSFSATTKTCSNVACHGVAAGTFSYYFPGNEMDEEGYPIPELKTVHYGGTMAAGTPSWYSTGASCSACHGNPPANGSDGSNVWHSGQHACNVTVGPTPANACALCHNDPANVNSPIALSSSAGDCAYIGTTIQIPALHGNGVNVNARFRSQCFGCH